MILNSTSSLQSLLNYVDIIYIAQGNLMTLISEISYFTNLNSYIVLVKMKNQNLFQKRSQS